MIFLKNIFSERHTVSLPRCINVYPDFSHHCLDWKKFRKNKSAHNATVQFWVSEKWRRDGPAFITVVYKSALIRDRGSSWHFKSKERLGKVSTLCHGARQLLSSVQSQSTVSRSAAVAFFCTKSVHCATERGSCFLLYKVNVLCHGARQLLSSVQIWGSSKKSEFS